MPEIPEGIVTIKPGREKPILQQHPWIFSGAIASARHAEPGGLVTVVSGKGDFLARGYWNPKSQIQVRILTWQDEPIDDDWWRRMFRRAMQARLADQGRLHRNVTAFRLINAENDFLPGLVVDVYDQWFVLQALTLGIEQRKAHLTELLADTFWQFYNEAIAETPDLAHELDVLGIYERSDVDVRRQEGLPPAEGVLWGEEPLERIRIREENLEYYVDIWTGHKTGFYLDQQKNRRILHDLIATDLRLQHQPHRVLNLFSYTGGFGTAALRAGAAAPGQVVNVDSSEPALKLAEENFALNFPAESGLNYADHAQFVQADVFEYLRAAGAQGEQFDVIVCDPPKFAHNKQQVDRATRGYKDLNLHCFRLIRPGGYLMTFSCSGAISADLFQKVVFGALADSGRQAQILRHLGPADDHPVALTFPEGEYLKGLLLRVY